MTCMGEAFLTSEKHKSHVLSHQYVISFLAFPEPAGSLHSLQKELCLLQMPSPAAAKIFPFHSLNLIYHKEIGSP